ncbi:MAG TPA: hypothetical protein DCQ93_08570 [Bacteroidetes bacterium]|nr:hypothetical protein [Bacteroidota bacterium]
MYTQVTDYKTLLQEKQRLEAHILDTEKRLKSKWRDLRNHYPEMILKPILPFSDRTNDKVFGWMEWVNDFLFNRFLGKEEMGIKSEAAKFIVRLAQVYFVRTITKFFQRKK